MDTRGTPVGPAGAEAPDAGLRGRLRWRCMRRGMLELDLLFERFLTRRFGSLDDGQLVLLERLLDYDDTKIWSILSGREECEETSLKVLFEMLRAD